MHADIQNVFTPALAIGRSERFAGRQQQLDRLSMALQSQGTQIVIYGNRGVGKSSLARQLEGLARGDMTVIDRLRMKPLTTPDYLVISLECDDTIPDVKTLVLRLLTDEACLAPWIPFKVEKHTINNEAGFGATIKILSMNAKAASQETWVREEVESDIYTVFANAIQQILDSGVVAGLLIIIDEVDRIRYRDELASLIRSRAADPRVKFALVGVGTTPQELILRHESISRQISDGCIEMPPMTEAELQEIFCNAEEALAQDGIKFSEEARDWIISIAKGHPYYVHLLGKHSLIDTVLMGETVVSLATAKATLAEIANKGTAPVQEATYRKAIGQSYTREYIIKAFAKEDGEEINTSVVYPKIAAGRGMDTGPISVYVGHLVTDKHGAILEKTRERHYRFKDSLFKAYAAARPFQFRPDQLETDVV